MIVRELLTKLGFVTDEKKVKAFDARVAGLKKSLVTLTKQLAITVGAITATAFRTAKAGDELAKTSRRLGIGVTALQEWRFAAQRAGVESRTFDMAIQRFGRRVAEATRGQGEAKDALAEMGIELTDVNGKLRDSDVLLTESLVALSKQENEFRRNALAMKLFDSEGVRLVQLAAEGADGIRGLREEFRALGGGISEEGVKASEEFIDAWTDVKAAINGVIFALGEKLLPLFTDVFRRTAKWVADNRKLVIVLAKVAAGIGIVTTVILGAVVAVKALAFAWAILNSQIFLIPLLIAAAIAAIVLIVEDIVAYTKGKDSLFGRLLEGLEKIWDAGAARLKIIFSEAWEDTKTKALSIWQDIVDRVGLMWQNFRLKYIDPIIEKFRRIRAALGLGPEAKEPLASRISEAIPEGLKQLLRGFVKLTPYGTERLEAARQARAAQILSQQMTVNIAVTPPIGTSAEGTARETVNQLKKHRNMLTSGMVRIGI